MPALPTITQAEARRIALAAQGLVRRNKGVPPTARQLCGILDRLAVFQIDSVSVLTRAHYLPLFSRLGAYDRTLFDEAAWGRKRRWFEYWGHEASLLPFALHPLMRWRMAEAARGEMLWPGLADFQRGHQNYIQTVRARIVAEGPVVAADLEGAKAIQGWWGWGHAKRALEVLFWTGEVTTATRRGFERVYDLTERVLPANILALPTPAKTDAQRELLRLSARAHGIGTAGDLADYFRISPRIARPILAELAEAGTVQQVTVENLPGVWFVHHEARMPRKIDAQALLAPFDPLVWERGRIAKLFAFDYRLEIYTPADKRMHGYYVLPFLFGDRLVARVDLKAERRSSTLHVLAAHAEADAPKGTAEALLDELQRLGTWLGLETVKVASKGNLARALKTS